MEILSIIFANLIFAVTFNFYYKIIRLDRAFIDPGDRSEIVEFVQTTLVLVVPIILLSIVVQHIEISGPLSALATIIWFCVTIHILKLYEFVFKAIFMAYVMSVAGLLISRIIVTMIIEPFAYSFMGLSMSFPILDIFVGIISIPIHFGIYQAIKLKHQGAKEIVEVKEKKPVRLGAPAVAGIVALTVVAMFHEFVAVNFWLSLGLAVVLIGFGLVFARQLKKHITWLDYKEHFE